MTLMQNTKYSTCTQTHDIHVTSDYIDV